MAVTDPIKVKAATITSSDFVSFDGGLDERGEYNIAPNSFSYGKNVRVNSANNVTRRLAKKKWLPNSVGFNSEVSTVYYDGQIYHFIADDGKIKYCQPNATSWTNCGGTNTITTTAGTITTFFRVNDILLCMNGVDKMIYVKLSDKTVNKFTHVDDPTATLTATPTGITSPGSSTVYYGITYNSDGGGQTAIGPILSKSVSKSRTVWKSDGTEYLTISFNDASPPAGATSRNLYAAVSITGATPTAEDMFPLEMNIPLATTTYVDNGSKPLGIFGQAPSTNTTDGIKAKAGIMAEDTPVLFGDPDNPYNVYFGRLTEDLVLFAGEGTQTMPLLKGTNYYPTSVIGFRNNQNIPSLLALFSGTEGVSKQQVISRNTLSYGNNSLEYWKAEDLNAGASAVYSLYGVVPYLGELLFPSSEGITSIKTEANLQNVLQPSIASTVVGATYSTIKNADFEKIVGTAWNNLVCFIIPSRGYSYNNQILVRDMTNRDKPKWYVWDMTADWIGTVSPPNADSFMYIRQGTNFSKLVDAYIAEDEQSDGTSSAYPVEVETSLKAFSEGRNTYMAVSQAVVYLAEFLGEVTVTVTYKNAKGREKTKSKTFTNGAHARNLVGGWGNPKLLWRSWNNRMINWSTPIPTNSDANNAQKIVKRCRVKLPNPVVNEVKIKVVSSAANTSFDLVRANLEGVNIGVVGDII